MDKDFRIAIGHIRNFNVFINSELVANDSILITGDSGSGKTTELIKIMTEIIKAGGTVVSMDTGGVFADDQVFEAYIKDYQRALLAIDVYNDGISCNMFETKLFSDGTKQKQNDLVDRVTEMFCRAYSLGIKQKIELQRAIKEVATSQLYNQQGIQSLDNVLRERGSNNSKALEVSDRIAKITRNNVFRAGDLFIKANKINILRLSKFSPDTQTTIAEMVISLIWDYSNIDCFKSNPIYLVLDESQNYNLGKNSILNILLAEGRKYGVNTILCTQLATRKEPVIQQMYQAGNIMHFKPPITEVGKLAKLIDPKKTKEWVNVISKLQVGEFIVSTPVMIGNRVSRKPLKVSARIN